MTGLRYPEDTHRQPERWLYEHPVVRALLLVGLLAAAVALPWAWSL